MSPTAVDVAPARRGGGRRARRRPAVSSKAKEAEEAYAEQNERDYEAFVAAITAGRLPASADALTG